MRTFKFLVAVALFAGCVASQGADTNTKPLGTGQEIEAHTLTLPPTDDGTVVMQLCTACPSFRFQITDASKYWIGQQEVGYAELRASFLAHPDALIFLELTQDRRSVVQLAISAYDAAR